MNRLTFCSRKYLKPASLFLVLVHNRSRFQFQFYMQHYALLIMGSSKFPRIVLSGDQAPFILKSHFLFFGRFRFVVLFLTVFKRYNKLVVLLVTAIVLSCSFLLLVKMTGLWKDVSDINKIVSILPIILSCLSLNLLKFIILTLLYY